MEDFRPFILSALIGLLVGFERQKAQPNREVSLGVRSFLLVGLLGSLTGWVTSPVVAAITSFFTMALIAVSYWLGFRTNRREMDLGITTELAAGVVFLLGYISHTLPSVAAFLGPLITLVLFSKKSLHGFTEKVRVQELQAVLLIILLGVGVINLVPNETIDAWGIFNPKQYGILVLVLASFEFGGYLAARIFRDRNAVWLLGFLGGLVSSTAMTMFSARQAKGKSQWRTYAGATLAAQLASLIQLFVILFFISYDLTFRIVPLILPSMLCIVGGLLYCTFLNKGDHQALEIKSPLDLKNLLRLSLLFGAILFVTGVARHFFGESGFQIVAFLTGLFELHAISLAIGTNYAQGSVAMVAAVQGLLLALIASFLAKIILSWILNRGPFSRFMALIFVMSSALTAGGYFLSL